MCPQSFDSTTALGSATIECVWEYLEAVTKVDVNETCSTHVDLRVSGAFCGLRKSITNVGPCCFGYLLTLSLPRSSTLVVLTWSRSNNLYLKSTARKQEIAVCWFYSLVCFTWASSLLIHPQGRATVARLYDWSYSSLASCLIVCSFTCS